jgi:hypothetical protein
MGKQIQIRVDESLAQILERVQKEVAESMKKQYNLDSITIYGTLASQIIAKKLSGACSLNFKIKKKGTNTGILELV